MGLKDLAGTSALEAALTTTNDHLQSVLDELRTTNNERLTDVVNELKALSDKVDRLVEQLGRSGTP
jgi:hypothetical protein